MLKEASLVLSKLLFPLLDFLFELEELRIEGGPLLLKYADLLTHVVNIESSCQLPLGIAK